MPFCETKPKVCELTQRSYAVALFSNMLDQSGFETLQ